MAGARSGPRGDLALVAAIVLATLAIERYIAGSLPGNRPSQLLASVGQNILEAGDGERSARSPWRILGAEWKDIFVRTYRQINEDRLLATAAGVVFYGLLAIFPAITALGLFTDPSTISDNLRTLALMLPERSYSVVQDQISRVLAKGPAALGATFLIGILFALWSANAGKGDH
jgi:membrane protein